jgi:catechol 2,3-dioxygenase-like lactoylglutathione lyase family enzyme
VSIKLNHTIVWCRDNERSAAFLTDLLGRPPGTHFGPFVVVAIDNEVSLDYHPIEGDINPQHFAFLISEDEFDQIFGRIQAGGVDHWADPMQSEAGEINHHDGGRGVYFEDPNGHLMEIITRPYGSA